MRIDLVVPNHESFGAEAVRASRSLEDMGYEGLWFTDHVVGYEAYKPVYGAYWLEVLTAMTHAAAVTEKVRIGSGVLVLPYRDPVYTAKVLSSIDELSGGRVDLGIGTGWFKPEFIALGRRHLFEQRGAVTNETLDVMLACWAAEGDEEIAFNGEFSTFRGIQFQPVTAQRPRIPVWIGSRGSAGPVVRRVAKYADVWHPTGLSPDEIRDGSAKINELAGREIPISVRTRLAGRSIEEFAASVAVFRDLGCIEVALDLEPETMVGFLSDAEALLAAVRRG